MSKKYDFINDVVRNVSMIAKAKKNLTHLHDVYYDESFDPGSIDQITDDCCLLSGNDFSSSEFENAIIFTEELNTFMNNGIPTQRNYDSAINKLIKLGNAI